MARKKNKESSGSSEIKYSDSNDSKRVDDSSKTEISGAEEEKVEPISNRLRGKQKDTNDNESNKLPKQKKNPKEKPQNLLEDFPAWHPAQITDELELYEQAQQQKNQLYSEPSVDLSTIHNRSMKEVAVALLGVGLVDPWTMPLIEFFHASTMLDPTASELYDGVMSFNNKLFLLPLFYFWKMVPTYYFRYMAVRTTTKNSATAKFEGITLKTKHQFQVGFFSSSNVLKGDL